MWENGAQKSEVSYPKPQNRAALEAMSASFQHFCSHLCPALPDTPRPLPPSLPPQLSPTPSNLNPSRGSSIPGSISSKKRFSSKPHLKQMEVIFHRSEFLLSELWRAHCLCYSLPPLFQFNSVHPPLFSTFHVPGPAQLTARRWGQCGNRLWAHRKQVGLTPLSIPHSTGHSGGLQQIVLD